MDASKRRRRTRQRQFFDACACVKIKSFCHFKVKVENGRMTYPSHYQILSVKVVNSLNDFFPSVLPPVQHFCSRSTGIRRLLAMVRASTAPGHQVRTGYAPAPGHQGYDVRSAPGSYGSRFEMQRSLARSCSIPVVSLCLLNTRDTLGRKKQYSPCLRIFSPVLLEQIKK